MGKCVISPVYSYKRQFSHDYSSRRLSVFDKEMMSSDVPWCSDGFCEDVPWLDCESSSSDEETVLLYSLTNRSKWVHPINKKRENFGEYHHLIRDLKLDDDRFKTYFRLNKDEFEEVLSIIDEDISMSTRMFQADRSGIDLCGRVQDVLGHTWMSMYASLNGPIKIHVKQFFSIPVRGCPWMPSELLGSICLLFRYQPLPVLDELLMQWNGGDQARRRKRVGAEPSSTDKSRKLLTNSVHAADSDLSSERF
ncbi:hypothetical protein J6590_054234 [Homalodisca vitripennis]|nr:hypothetical protein J6590_054234 [Homalodisca vitripennis]